MQNEICCVLDDFDFYQQFRPFSLVVSIGKFACGSGSAVWLGAFGLPCCRKKWDRKMYVVLVNNSLGTPASVQRFSITSTPASVERFGISGKRQSGKHWKISYLTIERTLKDFIFFDNWANIERFDT